MDILKVMRRKRGANNKSTKRLQSLSLYYDIVLLIALIRLSLNFNKIIISQFIPIPFVTEIFTIHECGKL